MHVSSGGRVSPQQGVARCDEIRPHAQFESNRTVDAVGARLETNGRVTDVSYPSKTFLKEPADTHVWVGMCYFILFIALHWEIVCFTGLSPTGTGA
jgi:hypothetical protein